MGSLWVISRYYWNESMAGNELAGAWSASYEEDMKYSKTCLKRNAIVPVFFFPFSQVSVYKGLRFNKTKYKKYDPLGLQ